MCLDGKSYYSPCHAGCSDWDEKSAIDGLEGAERELFYEVRGGFIIGGDIVSLFSSLSP